MTVLINRDTLKQAAERSGIDIDNGLGSTDPPVLSLEPTTVLPCLRGRDLLEAVRRVLPPGQKWWVTKLYCAGKISNFILYFLYILKVLIDWTLDLPIHLRAHLIEQSSIADGASDADIFRMLLCDYPPNTSKAWRNKFASDTDHHYVQRIDQTISLREAFKALTPYPGLWTPFTFRKLGHIVTPRFEEVISIPSTLL